MRPCDSIAGRDATQKFLFRRTLAVLVAGASVTGCVVSDSPPPPTLTARETFDQKAWSALGACVGCHGSQPAIAWMAPGTPDDAYNTMFTFQPAVIDLDSPAASLMLTMGKHTGPAMEAQASATVLDWLVKERAERVQAGDSPLFGPVKPTMNAPTTVELGLGAKLTFTASAFDDLLALDGVSITATTAVHVVHPLFVSRPVGKTAVVDGVDRYDDVDVVIPAGTTQTFSPATFLDFAAADPITISFLELEAAP